MFIVSRDARERERQAPEKTGRLSPRSGGAFALAVGLLLLGYVIPAQAQLSATLTEKVNVVKVRQGSALFVDAKIRQALAMGDGLRTGARSQARVTFSDKSVLRVNELSDIVIRAGANQRDVGVDQGRVYGNLKGPARFRGRYAVAAVRGTRLEMAIMGTRTMVRCWSGSVVVAGADAQIVAGYVTTPGANMFASENLIGSTENWIGARIDFTLPDKSTSSRQVAAFDPATGTVTLDQPQPTTSNQPFVLLLPAEPYVVLPAGYETYVRNQPGATPHKPYPTEPEEFADGDQWPWMDEGLAGDQETYRYGYLYDRFREQYYEIDTARESSKFLGGEAPGIQPIFGGNLSGNIGNGNGSGSSGGTLGVGIGNNSGPNGGTLQVGIGGKPNPPPNGNLIVTIGSGRAAGSGRAIGFFPRPPEVGGVAYTTTYSDSAFFYTHSTMVLGNLFFRVGGRFGTLDRTDNNQLDQLILRYRAPHVGDIQAGRFHWFPGPISNGELGRLYSFTTADGVLWQLPTGRATQVQLSWFDHINPLVGPRAGGFAGRALFHAGKGRVGFSALTTSQKTVGFGFDGSWPILPQVLEFYGETGRDTSHKGFYAIGAYFPQLLQRYRADLTIEYAYRGFFGTSLDLDLHLPVTRYISLLATLSKPGARSWEPGIGVQAVF